MSIVKLNSAFFMEVIKLKIKVEFLSILFSIRHATLKVFSELKNGPRCVIVVISGVKKEVRCVFAVIYALKHTPTQ